MLEGLGLRLRVLLFFAALAAGCLAALIAGLTLGYRHLADPAALPGFVNGGLIAGFGIVGLVAGIWYLFDQNVARAILSLAGGMRARAHADVDSALDHAPARYLGDLAPAAAAVTQSLAETRNALAEAVARETTRLAAEKARLEALLSDVPVGVLLCSPDHQLAFYNSHAVELLGAGPGPEKETGPETDPETGLDTGSDAGPDAGSETALGEGHEPGLDRAVFDYLREAPIAHAYQRLLATDDPDAASDLLCATVGSAQVLSARMRLTGGGEARPGYVLTLRDVTRDLAAHAAREELLAEVFDRVRRPAANLQTVIGVLTEEGAAAGELALTAAMRAEIADLTRAVTELGNRHDALRADWWPLAATRASDLADGIRARIEAGGGTSRTGAAELLLRCDGFGIVALVSELAARVMAADLGGDLAVDISEDGAGAVIDLTWAGSPVGVGQLERWLDAPLEVGMADVTGRSVLATHATECWPDPRGDGRAAIRLPIREARRAHARPAPVARAVVYDFDLLSKARNDKVADSRLEDLTYVVFDTETTGLSPAGGDEIVQIAAVRLVNGRRIEGEVFDTLVNPGRRIPPSSTEVHGITDAMVADAPGIDKVGRRFHRFATGAVLIAHNAPFDMEFLRRHEADIGARFDHPIFDTVLLSAVVFGQTETHSLDALTHRLGITIPEEARHTAIGDTVATAEAFLRLVPMLKAQGLETFGDVLAEMRKHGRLLEDLNG